MPTGRRPRRSGSPSRARRIDPDYRTAWPDGSDVTSVSADGDMITVDLTGDVQRAAPPACREEEAELAVQQVVYTAQAVAEQGRLPVQITLDGASTDQVLGVPASEPFSNAPRTRSWPWSRSAACPRARP